MRLALTARGVVPAVGFRPFAERMALDSFPQTRAIEGPGPAKIAPRMAPLDFEERDDARDSGFRVLRHGGGAPAPVVPTDFASCPACLGEIADPHGRRHRYPFTSCARCGPRYSIALAAPYDRAATTMRGFSRCDDCEREYQRIGDRRYHAEAIACPACGPTLSWRSGKGALLAFGDEALAQAVSCLKHGAIVALRGIGGFHLLCDATAATTVAELRKRKRRPHAPFALLLREADVPLATDPTVEELAALQANEAPIVLCAKREGGPIADEVAPASPWLGAMLPYSPLHRLIAERAARPLVCTSGNIAGEPICTGEDEALTRLRGIADGFLSHDRPIARPIDDSVVRVGPRGVEIVKRARGYAPRPVAAIDEAASVLALGAQRHGTVALGHRGALVLSQPLGDLDFLAARELCERTVRDLCRFHRAEPAMVACDYHPDYGSTRVAETLAARWNVPLFPVQHHHAHVAAAMAENGFDGAVLGLAWDGGGLGLDGTIWGGEALVCRGHEMQRFAALRAFPLPGGERAIREPRRSALGLLHAVAPDLTGSLANPRESEVMVAAMARGINAPLCSSVGRLFDAVAALVGAGEVSYEGQAAVALEALALRCLGGSTELTLAEGGYPLPLSERRGAAPHDAQLIADPEPLVRELLADRARGVASEIIATRFHAALVALGVALCERAGIERVVLAGGCFQNRLLSDALGEELSRRGFLVLRSRAVPINDGGISAGQVWIAALAQREARAGKGAKTVSSAA